MIKVLKQALEALEDVGVLTDREWQAVHKNKANELRQAIAELESQKPFAYVNVEMRRLEFATDYVKWDTPTTIKLDKIPLYTYPPQEQQSCDKRTEQEPVAWLGFNPRSGAPEFACDKPAPSVMRDYNMKPLVYTNSTPPAAQPAQEPVAWMYQEYRDDDQFGWRDEIYFIQPPNDPIYFRNIVPVYAHLPQRTWVGLTDDEVNTLWGEWKDAVCLDHKTWAKAIEAKLKEKNCL
jgi:hypothetical protein